MTASQAHVEAPPVDFQAPTDAKASPHAFTTLNVVRDAVGMSMAEKSILLVLALHADGKTGERAFPSQETIAAEACSTSRTVRRGLDSLEASGLIVRGEQFYAPKRPQGGKKVIVWNLNLTALRARRYDCTTESDFTSASECTPEVEQPDTVSYCNRTSVHEQPDTVSYKQPLEQPLVTTPKAAPLQGEASPQADDVPALGARIKKSREEQRLAEDFELAAGLLEEHCITCEGETDQGETAWDIYGLLVASGKRTPGKWMQGVENQSDGIGTGVLDAVCRQLDR